MKSEELKYCVGQKVCLGFSVIWYGKSQMNFLANPVCPINVFL